MKILRRIIATILIIIMVPLVVAESLFLVASIHLQPENFANLTSDIIADTLSKDNLKQIKVSDLDAYLPSGLTADLPPDATAEQALPAVFSQISGIENYISLETAEQMLEDDVVKDLTLAIMNEQEYDLVALADKYQIPLAEREREALATVKTSTIKGEANRQGYNLDELASEQVNSGALSSTNSTNSQNEFAQFFATFNPWLVTAGLIATVAIFYLLCGLVLWDLKSALIWWGAGLTAVGTILLIFNFAKYSLVEFGLGMMRQKINPALIAPALKRLARPVILTSILELFIGIGVIVGGILWCKHTSKSESKTTKTQK